MFGERKLYSLGIVEQLKLYNDNLIPTFEISRWIVITVNPLPQKHEGLEEKKRSFSYEVGSLGDPGPNTERIRDDTLTSFEDRGNLGGFSSNLNTLRSCWAAYAC